MTRILILNLERTQKCSGLLPDLLVLGGISFTCTLHAERATWGPFLESPGNFTGPKSKIQIEK